MREVIRWNTELVAKFIYENDKCELLSEYNNAKEVLIMKCSCGKSFERSINKFKNNVRKGIPNVCPECQTKRRKHACVHGNDQLKEYFKDYKNCEFLYKEEDSNMAYFLCKCGKIFCKTVQQAKATKFNRCADCAKKSVADGRRTFDYEKIKNELIGLNIDFSKIYMANSLRKLKIDTSCSVCGETFTGTYYGVVVYNKKMCKKCIILKRSKKISLDFYKIIQKAEQYELEVITRPDEYVNRQSKILLLCKKHPEELIETTWWALRDYCPCKKCTCGNSSYEAIVTNILDEIGIPYKPHVIDKKCKYIRPLQFDFVIYSDLHKKNRIAIIEANGQQHYSPVQFGGITIEEAEALFEIQKIKDQIKRDFCLKNNIPLLELKYNETDKYELLIKEFLQNSIERKAL